MRPERAARREAVLGRGGRAPARWTSGRAWPAPHHAVRAAFRAGELRP